MRDGLPEGGNSGSKLRTKLSEQYLT